MRYWTLSAVFRLLGMVPVGLQRWLSRPLGRLAWLMSGTKRNSTLKNLAGCYPHLSAAGRERLGRESMRHYVLIALETGISWYWPKSKLLSLFDEPAGMEHVRRARDGGRGLLILAPHCGNWELLNQWMQTKLELASLYKPGRYRDFEDKLLQKRKRLGGELVPTTTPGLKVLVKYLKTTRAALLLPDQDPSAGEGRFAPFFGIPALTGVLASRMGQQTGCTAVFAVCVRTEGGRFRVHILPAEDDFYSPDIDVSLAALNRGVENCIAIDPGQYLWAYKRFKTRPQGEPGFY